jgi:hypothetical protein
MSTPGEAPAPSPPAAVQSKFDPNVCMTCDAALRSLPMLDRKKCDPCNEIYYTCRLCRDALDWCENDKGVWCMRCDRHFCIVCWQNTGMINETTDEYLCEACLKLSN